MSHVERVSAKQYRVMLGLDPAPRPVVPPAKPTQPAEALAGGDQGETQGSGCPLVRFVLFGVQLFDVDAKYTAIKDLLDGLQYAGLIRGDKEGQVRLQVDQVRVHHRYEERTEIEITY